MVISPSPLVSPAEQSATGLLPRAMFTIVTSSSMVTAPSPPQSPGHDGGAWVGVWVSVAVGNGGGVGVGLGVSVKVAVGVSVKVAVAVLV
jgi:hypothetical protein